MKRNNQKRAEKHDAVAIAPTPINRGVRQPVDYQNHERQPVVNQAAVDLLESWQAGDEQEQRDTWEYLKQTLEEDRLSDRTLLP